MAAGKKITWFAADCCIHTNPKVLELAEHLKLDVDTLVGKLCRLWAWAKLCGNESGHIGKLPDQEIADIMRWRKSPRILVQALVDLGFLDEDATGKTIHGWYELNGKNTEKQRHDRERKG